MKFIDLFAGVGGTRLAFERAGFECVFSSEWDRYSQKTYERNFGDKPFGDIREIQAKDIPDFDVLVAGFPCQPFSSVGLRQGFDHRTQGTMFYEIERILRTKSPRAFLLENVKGLLTHSKGETWRVIQETLAELGYSFEARVQNAKNFGVPQSRERLFVVGFKSNSDLARFSFPTGSQEIPDISDFLESGVSGYAITKHLQDSYLFKIDDGKPQILSKGTSGPARTLVASYHKIQRLTGSFVLDGSTGLRLLTERECKAMMGFPEDFVFPVSRTQMYRQLGNSVVVPHVAAIAASIRVALDIN